MTRARLSPRTPRSWCRGRADDAEWLSAAEVQVLLSAAPSGNVPPDQAIDFAQRAVADVAGRSGHLDSTADILASRLREDHIRVREAGGQTRGVDRGPCPETRGHPRRLRLPAGRERLMTDFGSVKIVGGLLPADLLGRVFAGDSQVPGTGPDTYGLEHGESVRRQASRSWLYLVEVSQTSSGASATEYPAPVRGPRGPPGNDGCTSCCASWASTRSLRKAASSWTEELPGQPQVRPRACAPAGWATDLDHKTPHVTARAPQSMVQELLNRDDSLLWAILSNGAVLRLLRDSTTLVGSSYVEFDLAAIFDGELFSDFVLLYLICHESRFATHEDGASASCYLEQWRGFAAEQGERALDQLRDGSRRPSRYSAPGFYPTQTTRSSGPAGPAQC